MKNFVLRTFVIVASALLLVGCNGQGGRAAMKAAEEVCDIDIQSDGRESSVQQQEENIQENLPPEESVAEEITEGEPPKAELNVDAESVEVAQMGELLAAPLAEAQLAEEVFVRSLQEEELLEEELLEEEPLEEELEEEEEHDDSVPTGIEVIVVPFVLLLVLCAILLFVFRRNRGAEDED